MDKVIEALGKLLPKEQLTEVTSAVKAMFEEAKKEIETEYNKNLEEAYQQLSGELKEAERVGEEGYREALAIIQDQSARRATAKLDGEGQSRA